jgi:hypothetical protein
MAASLVLAGRGAGHKNADAEQAVIRCIERYCTQMRAFAKMTMLEVNRFQVHRLGGIEPVHEALTKAERSTPQHTLEELTGPAPTMKGSQAQGKVRRFKESKPC